MRLGLKEKGTCIPLQALGEGELSEGKDTSLVFLYLGIRPRVQIPQDEVKVCLAAESVTGWGLPMPLALTLVWGPLGSDAAGEAL